MKCFGVACCEGNTELTEFRDPRQNAVVRFEPDLVIFRGRSSASSRNR